MWKSCGKFDKLNTNSSKILNRCIFYTEYWLTYGTRTPNVGLWILLLILNNYPLIVTGRNVFFRPFETFPRDGFVRLSLLQKFLLIRLHLSLDGDGKKLLLHRMLLNSRPCNLYLRNLKYARRYDELYLFYARYFQIVRSNEQSKR